MNAAKTKAKALKKYATIARVMSQTANKAIKINISGNGAYTDCSSMINLPTGDFNDENYIRLLEGAIDHEAGHIKHTNVLTVNESYAKGNIVKQFTNLFEDIRMEGCVKEEYRGSIKNLNAMVSAMIDMDLFKEPDFKMKTLELVFFYCLYNGRLKYGFQKELTELSRLAHEALVIQGQSKLVTALDDEMKALKITQTTDDAMQIAIKVVDLLKNEDGSGDNSNDSSDDEDNSDSNGSGDNSNDSSDDEDNSDSNGSGDNSNDSSDDEDNSDSNGSGDSNSNYSQGNNVKEKILEGSEKFEGFDIHEAVREAMEKLSDQTNSEDCYREVLDDKDISRITYGRVVDKKTAKRLSQQVYPALERIFKDKVRTNASWDKRGSNLDCDLLAGVATGQYNVFKKETIRTGNSAAISLLVDKSGSMDNRTDVEGNTDMDIANLSALSLMYSFEKLKGVSSECVYFDDSVHVAKAFSEKLKVKNLNVYASHYTELARGMIFSLRRLAVQPENKKFMFILTDGNTSGELNEIKQVKEEAESLGVTIFAVGINLGYKMPGFGRDFSILKDVSLFPSVIKEVIRKKM